MGYTVIWKDLSNKTIITIANFSYHKHFIKPLSKCVRTGCFLLLTSLEQVVCFYVCDADSRGAPAIDVFRHLYPQFLGRSNQYYESLIRK